MRLIDRLKALRRVEGTLLVGGVAGLLATGQPAPALGLVLGALLHGALYASSRRSGARALGRPFRTERARGLEVAVPEEWFAHGDHTGLYLSHGGTSMLISWHEQSPGLVPGADLEHIATRLIEAHAEARTVHDLEPCDARLLGVDARGRRAAFAGWELTLVEAYAVSVPTRSALVSVITVRTEAVPEALLRRCIESLALTQGGQAP